MCLHALCIKFDSWHRIASCVETAKLIACIDQSPWNTFVHNRRQRRASLSCETAPFSCWLLGSLPQKFGDSLAIHGFEHGAVADERTALCRLSVDMCAFERALCHLFFSLRWRALSLLLFSKCKSDRASPKYAFFVFVHKLALTFCCRQCRRCVFLHVWHGSFPGGAENSSCHSDQQVSLPLNGQEPRCA